jgi:hypothetical protein
VELRAEERVCRAMQKTPPTNVLRCFALGIGAIALAGCTPRGAAPAPTPSQTRITAVEDVPAPIAEPAQTPAPDGSQPRCELHYVDEPEIADPCPPCGRG